MEFSRSQTASILTHTPIFSSLEGGVNWEKLHCHLKETLSSDLFVGFTISSVFETEDLVEKFNLYPHVFLERTILYRPSHPRLAEMCMLLSMLEHHNSPTSKFLTDVLNRASKLAKRLGSREAGFLLAGIQMIIATVAKTFNIQLPLDISGKLPSPLVPFLLYQNLGRAELSASGFLRDIYLSSFKMHRSRNDGPMRQSIPFNIFYQDTLLAKHFQNYGVVSGLRKICQCTRPRLHILQ